MTRESLIIELEPRRYILSLQIRAETPAYFLVFYHLLRRSFYGRFPLIL